MERKQYAVLGLGIFGSALAKTLSEYDVDLIVADSDLKCVDRMKNFTDQQNVIDITDKEALREIGVGDCDVAVVAVGSNLEAAILAVMHCKELGVPKVVAKARNKRNREILLKIGADFVVRPEKDMGTRIAKRLLTKDIVEIIEVDAKNSIVEMHAPKEWVNRSLIEIDARAKFGINIIGVRRNGELITSLVATFKILEHDILLAIGETKAFERFDYIAHHK